MSKKIMKVPIGIPVLDDKFSGIYVGHVTFLTGASGEGREVAVGAALNSFYRLDEQVLAVFAESADHIALRAREVGYDLEKATEIGALSILYHSYKPGEVLPVRESLEEIIAEAHRISAAVLFIQDARPWLEVHPVSGSKSILFLPLQSASRNSSRHSKNPGLPPSWPCRNPSPPQRRRCGRR